MKQAFSRVAGAKPPAVSAADVARAVTVLTDTTPAKSGRTTNIHLPAEPKSDCSKAKTGNRRLRSASFSSGLYPFSIIFGPPPLPILGRSAVEHHRLTVQSQPASADKSVRVMPPAARDGSSIKRFPLTLRLRFQRTSVTICKKFIFKTS